MGNIQSLVCSRCSAERPVALANLCECGGPLLVHYDLSQAARPCLRSDMWRYESVLPCSAEQAVSLGEGWTPLLPAPSLGNNVWIKDESRNPTDSFKARGLSAAISMARKFGVRKVAIPSAGNAGGALAAYAARAGMEAHIFMPSDVPLANVLESRATGSHVTLIDGLISDCGRIVNERKAAEGWFDVSTLKEPYRIEGKKTMGYEIAEQFGWEWPDAIIYPCGGGVGLIGIWKAVAEMAELGWVRGKAPKMIAVQAAGCAPIVRAFQQGVNAKPWNDAQTIAAGLRVPAHLGAPLILKAVEESGGTAISVTDREMMNGALLLARSEGIFAAPETGACVAALPKLVASGAIGPVERVVIISTASGYKYLEAFQSRLGRAVVSEYEKLGGLITPR